MQSCTFFVDAESKYFHLIAVRLKRSIKASNIFKECSEIHKKSWDGWLLCAEDTLELWVVLQFPMSLKQCWDTWEPGRKRGR